MSTGKPTAKDYEMMDRAIQEARDALASGKVGVAALLLWQEEILALGHNAYVETGDMTAHAEMVVLRTVARRLSQMSEQEKAQITIYVTLQPCLMCFSAISFVGIKRIVYAALNDDGKEIVEIADGISIEHINNALVCGPIELVPGVRREEGKQLLAVMGKLAK